MAAIQVNYKTPGSSDTQNMAVMEGLTVGEFVEDVLGLSTSNNDIRVNGCPAIMDAELQAGDTIVATAQKFKSGFETR